MTNELDSATDAALEILMASLRARVQIKRFKISREQAVLYAEQLSDNPLFFATEDDRSNMLGKILSGRCTFSNVPVKVIA